MKNVEAIGSRVLIKLVTRVSNINLGNPKFVLKPEDIEYAEIVQMGATANAILGDGVKVGDKVVTEQGSQFLTVDESSDPKSYENIKDSFRDIAKINAKGKTTIHGYAIVQAHAIAGKYEQDSSK